MYEREVVLSFYRTDELVPGVVKDNKWYQPNDHARVVKAMSLIPPYIYSPLDILKVGFHNRLSGFATNQKRSHANKVTANKLMKASLY